MTQALSDQADTSTARQSQQDARNDEISTAFFACDSRFRELADNLPAYVWLSNEKGERLYSNKQWSAANCQCGQERCEHWTFQVYAEDRDRLMNLYATNSLDPKRLETEYRVVDSFGKLCWLKETVVPRFDQDKKFVGFLGCAIDITRQKSIAEHLEQDLRAQTHTLHISNQRLAREKQEHILLNSRFNEALGQLGQQDKMALLGKLAAGVAHEINNPLGYIHSNLNTLHQYMSGLQQVTDMAKRLAAQLPEDHAEVAAFNRLADDLELDAMQRDAQELVEESMEGATRASHIIQDLLEYSHISSQKRELFDIEKGLDATLNIVHNKLKYKANIHKDYAGIPAIECIGSQLNQVFMNLLVNAAQAIEKFGDITIRTGLRNADCVWVELEDSGCGISEEIRAKIFEPFFTTKPVGVGTGLGLSLTRKIIEDNQGEIELDSTEGRGTRFRIYFPVKAHGKQA